MVLSPRHDLGLDHDTAIIIHLIDLYPYPCRLALFDKVGSCFVDLFSKIDNAHKVGTGRDRARPRIGAEILAAGLAQNFLLRKIDNVISPQGFAGWPLCDRAWIRAGENQLGCVVGAVAPVHSQIPSEPEI